MPINKNQEYLFVYGSLQRGANHAAHTILTKYAKFIGDAVAGGKLYLVEDYPGIIPANPNSHSVSGELYLLTDPQKAFIKLDSYEGYDPKDPVNSLYLRKKRRVFCQEIASNSVEAWTYIYNRPTEHLPQINSGNYLSYIKNKSLD